MNEGCGNIRSTGGIPFNVNIFGNICIGASKAGLYGMCTPILGWHLPLGLGPRLGNPVSATDLYTADLGTGDILLGNGTMSITPFSYWWYS